MYLHFPSLCTSLSNFAPDAPCSRGRESAHTSLLANLPRDLYSVISPNEGLDDAIQEDGDEIYSCKGRAWNSNGESVEVAGLLENMSRVYKVSN